MHSQVAHALRCNSGYSLHGEGQVQKFSVWCYKVGCSFSFGGKKKKKVSKRQLCDPAGDLK